MKKVYICKKCGKVVISDNMTEKFCTADGGQYVDTGISEDAWNAMDENGRNTIINANKEVDHKEQINKAVDSASAAAKTAGENISAAAKTASAGIKETYEKSSVLYNNIGSKICTLARVVAWIGIILSVIVGLVTFATAGFFSGLMVIIIGALTSWISSMALYGFGHLILRTDEIADKIR
ncbi:MAG: hypothetical protein LKF79_02775 [Solobacterium sp.]|jgi:hypothetical protein|nr:hypothetical protein [Solobacterium sp.]MCH4221945.1 hypothetical protein [Solobacterium sp.]MCH4265550.1 hypothetical protein [Solobacterium sp.]